MIRQDWSTLKKLMFAKTAAAGAAVTEATATGNPLTFVTDLARPLKSLLIPFTPVQSGTGDPSPQNIRSIIPWNGLKVGQINGTAPVISNNSGMANADGEWKNTVTDSKTRFDAYIQLYKDSTYIKGAGSKAIASSGVYSITFNVDDANCNRIVFLHSGSQNNLSVRFPFNLPQGTYTISFNVVSANPSVIGGLAIKDIFLVEGSTVDRSETDISFSSPVYGGTLDVVSGVLTNNRYPVNITPQEVPNINIDSVGSTLVTIYIQYATNNIPFVVGNTVISNRFSRSIASGNAGRMVQANDGVYLVLPADEMSGTDMEAVREWFANNPTILVFELATPTEQTLTGHQITALVGNNTIWSDADGSMTATYLKKG